LLVKVGLDPDGWGGFDSVGFVLALPCSTLSKGPKALVQYGHSLFDDRCSMTSFYGENDLKLFLFS